ncbi:hypothetical protein [Rhizobium sp. GCM10022189]|uniref:hypothetical protein n=1 Tax=Rhizobium sp. GCM10022189 TaxID=3252654 RepID=UPI00360DF65F
MGQDGRTMRRGSRRWMAAGAAGAAALAAGAAAAADEAATQPTHAALTSHVPGFITAPGETDILFVIVIVMLLVIVLAIGNFYFQLHAVPERIAHRANKGQLEIVAVLALISLFTHNHIYWIIGLLLALVRIPDFATPLYSIARSVARLASGAPEPGQPAGTAAAPGTTAGEPDIAAPPAGTPAAHPPAAHAPAAHIPAAHIPAANTPPANRSATHAPATHAPPGHAPVTHTPPTHAPVAGAPIAPVPAAAVHPQPPRPATSHPGPQAVQPAVKSGPRGEGI